jgi:type II secretory pathway component PulM
MRRLLRMARWARRPRRDRRVLLTVGVVAACLLVVAVERWVGGSEALTPGRAGAGRPAPAPQP